MKFTGYSIKHSTKKLIILAFAVPHLLQNMTLNRATEKVSALNLLSRCFSLVGFAAKAFDFIQFALFVVHIDDVFLCHEKAERR